MSQEQNRSKFSSTKTPKKKLRSNLVHMQNKNTAQRTHRSGRKQTVPNYLHKINPKIIRNTEKP